MSIALYFSTDWRDFEGRPRACRIARGFIAAWLWFEVRVSR